MPLTRIQTDVLSILAGRRSPKSYVGGGTPLNRAGPRTSDDIDIFQGPEVALLETADGDAACLEASGYVVTWRRRMPAICTADIVKDNEQTRLDWVTDSDHRFFPPTPDLVFGFVLHPADIATGKALAAAGRREPRDAVDLVYIHSAILPLGATIWAAVAKDPGWSPESMINEIRRSARYQDYDLEELDMSPPLSAAELSQKLRTALKEADAFVSKMPSEKAGLLFFEGDRLVQPDPDHLERYVTHAGQRGGHWPSSPEIASAMLRAWSPKA